MNQFQLLKTTRRNALRLVDGMTNEQLNFTPEKFNNNLIWNLGHILVTQQLLCYRLSNTTCEIQDDMLARYRKGTKPDGRIIDSEINYIKERLISTIDQMEEDFKEERFGVYNPYQTSYGMELKSVADAIAFNNIHESMHLGAMLSLVKLV